MGTGSAREVRLLLAEDHLVVRQGLRVLLEQEGFSVVAEASDGRHAVEACHALQPDLAILDIAMPRLNGIDAARTIRQLSPGTHVMLLTMYAEADCVLESLRAGVRAFIVKSHAASHLVAAIEAVMNGQMYFSPSISAKVVEAYLAGHAAPAGPLSGREREVLQLLAEGRSVKEIGALLGISARTAETHRTRLMAKLNIHDVPGLVRYAIEHRLIAATPAFNDEPERARNNLPER